MRWRPAAAAVLVAGVLASCGSSGRAAAPTTTGAPAATTAAPPVTASAPTTSGPTTTAAPTTTAPSTVGAAWASYDHDAGRTGVDPTTPAATTVAAGWTSAALDGAIYAQPLVVGFEVIVATENDTVYALDAATGALRWSRHLGTPVPGSSLPCGNIDPSGITGTPVADPESGVLWVVTFSEPAHHTLWTLNLATGSVMAQRGADPPGADPTAEQERGALAFSSGTVYVPYGGLYGDCADYHGWVVGLDSAPGSTVESTYVTPTAREAGIWAPPGPVVAADDTLFVATGNGEPATAVDDADSVVHLSATLRVLGTFTPADYAHLSDNDLDLGSTSPTLVAGSLVFQIGKDGVGYLLDAGHLGGVGGSVASLQVCQGGFGGTAVDGDLVLVSCYDGLFAVRVTRSGAGGRPTMTVAWAQRGTARPGPPIVAGGHVWAVDKAGDLVGYAEQTGAVTFRAPVQVISSFPTLSAASSRLYVPSGDRLATFVVRP